MRPIVLGLIAAGVIGVGLAFGAKKAKAAVPPSSRAPVPEPVPVPTPSAAAAAAAAPTTEAGIQCRDAFRKWQSLASRESTLALCKDAADLNEEWWRQEDQRIAGDPFYDADRHNSLLNAYDQAIRSCESANAESLYAMNVYESCMRNLGLDPTKPSAATKGRFRRR